MTLLLFEKQRADDTFDSLWQQEHGPALGLARQDLGLLHDHLAFLIYEFFPEAPVGAARRVMLAARAAGVQSLLIERLAEDTLPEAPAAAALRWLAGLAEEQLRACLPDEAAFWAQYAEWPQRCRSGFGQNAAVPDLARLSELVADRTAAAYQTAAAFGTLSGHPERLGAVRRAQGHLYTGATLYREMLSWKQDFCAGRRTYLLEQLRAGAPELRDLSPEQRQGRLAELGRRLYYGGLADHLLAEAAEQFCRAMAEVTELPPTPWGGFVAHLMEQSERLRRDIAQIRAQKLAAIRPERVRAQPDVMTSAEEQPIQAEQIRRAETAGCGYLAREQSPGGFWGDFLLLAEQSTYWVTGYVAWTLQQVRPDAADLGRAAAWLLEQQYPEGGWGYNSHWPIDTDTSANALLFLSSRPGADPAAWRPALDVVYSGQRAGGGFTTILRPEVWTDRFRVEEARLEGWTSAHPCVTAVVALLLASLGRADGQAPLERALAYLWTCQSEQGFWPAYWWAGMHYTTCRTVQTLAALGQPLDGPRLALTRAWLVRSQLPDGGWSDDQSDQSQAFQTALAVLTLGHLAHDEPSRAALRRAARWLVERQRPDGSWASAPSLRCPRPHVTRPWEQREWTPSIIGLDVVVPDWHRLFTTATAVQALHACGELLM
jgi:squalene-hopene/tetraprenyl-beta-curcumene cyclase